MPLFGAPLTKSNAQDDTPFPGVKAVRDSEKARRYVELADRYLESIGYTEHGYRHCDVVSQSARRILKDLQYPERDSELAAVAGLLHDIGNMAGRDGHQNAGALLAKELMQELGFPLEDIGRVMAAIVIHELDEGVLEFDPVAAALVIADKADVHRSRVRTTSMLTEDIHDRVNYAATDSELLVDAEGKLIKLSVTIDNRISQVIEYFEIFLSRMAACRKAAAALGCEFHLYINGNRMA